MKTMLRIPVIVGFIAVFVLYGLGLAGQVVIDGLTPWISEHILAFAVAAVLLLLGGYLFSTHKVKKVEVEKIVYRDPEPEEAPSPAPAPAPAAEDSDEPDGGDDANQDEPATDAPTDDETDETEEEPEEDDSTGDPSDDPEPDSEEPSAADDDDLRNR